MQKNGSSPGTSKKVMLKKGIVVSDKMDKTIVVRIDSVTRHHVYKKVIGHSRKVKAHDEKNTAKTGNVVAIEQTRPRSRDKRWILKAVIEKGNG